MNNIIPFEIAIFSVVFLICVPANHKGQELTTGGPFSMAVSLNSVFAWLRVAVPYFACFGILIVVPVCESVIS